MPKPGPARGRPPGETSATINCPIFSPTAKIESQRKATRCRSRPPRHPRARAGAEAASWNIHIRLALCAAARGIDRHGNTVGFFTGDGVVHGFLLTGGVASQIDYPDASAVATYLESLNSRGLVAGEWDDGSGNLQAFILDTSTATFTPITVPGATYVESFGINTKGIATVSSDAGIFLYCPLRPRRCPSGIEVAQAKSIHVDPATFLHYGRAAHSTGHSAPVRASFKNPRIAQP